LALASIVSAAGAATNNTPGQAEEQAAHVLNRIAFGARPGDIERVAKMGVNRYIDEQLYPERIALPKPLSARLAELPVLRMSQGALVARFRDIQRQVKDDKEQGKDARRDLVRELSEQAGEARLISAIDSPRQLEEVMVDFWYNHFNVFAGKGLDRSLVANYEQEAIRPYALGKFRDLLAATAHHPAMLFYLDNWLSSAPGYQAPNGGAQKLAGLNENYARELMELHTLGVDGGYSQKDVTELARILTGWTFDPREKGEGSTFRFDARRHDWGTKQWLNRTVAPRGQAEGEWALNILAQSPATAHHISYELAQYFVNDTPPKALVERMTQRYLATDGDIRAVLATLLHSPEFLDPATEGAKFKTPYQYVVSAVRASGIEVYNVRPLLGTLTQLGMPLYGCQTPDGYKNTEDAWLNSDAMTRRINFATALASGRLPLERRIDEASLSGRPADRTLQNPATASAGDDRLPPPEPLDADRLLDTLGESISGKTLTALANTEPQLRAALVLGSPDFMRR
jgi:uncharacterized protein (DUF1800 family)